MYEDRTNFRPKVGETYQLRGGGTGEVIFNGLNSGADILAVITRIGNAVRCRTYNKHGFYYGNMKHDIDLMPPVPEKKYRPWTREELLEFAKRDGWVVNKHYGHSYLISTITRDGVVRIDHHGIDAVNFLRHYTQADKAKTPCGVAIDIKQESANC